ncbi:unnamed protein product [Adineta steineri]|uniref:G-protein coupled receptors family 1 profile domain-containing protein n=1 Tax=Adineta steineri TaxID=433720 RepID=A0A819HC78_9BILA|nr:unnamed protein product [Adineta steineri]CAF1383239.1 unnamed protein product [Adineta steineri]CAF3895342.1 unnamed protein product [Adineta steineri]CAF4072970.1 unnamed protein product [Adineta steineri]
MDNATTVLRASSSTGDILTAMPYLFNIWLGTFLVIMGNIDCIGNIIIYQSPTFRKQAYTVYLLAETISDVFVINLVLLTRVIEKGYGIPVYTTRYEYICKIRQTSSYYFVLTSFTFFTLATIDRILSTQRSNWLRKWSNRVSLAYKMVISCTVIWLLLIGHRFFIYALVNGKCNPQFEIYDEIDHYIEAIIMEFGPLLTVFILACLLRKSLQTIIQRQANVVTIGKKSRIQQIDSQITLMLIVQALIASYLSYRMDWKLFMIM